ncbi:hypothetical protein SAMN04488500_102159 [Sporomusa malonica]|uniref:Uncharacterized protein n=1 Tax=Sporomusa malonica TaxID=112901 RepID=A0A1W1YSV0_9FIRM|nr:hypothetical protein SAMN04488500_102159 [Sporomusa malonica]
MNTTDYLESLKQQLLDLGYSSYQIDTMYQDMIGTCSASSPSPDQYLTLVIAMEDYIKFAKKNIRKRGGR